MRSFNDLFGDVEWHDQDKIQHLLHTEIPAKVAADHAYQNAIRQGDKANARIEHDRALQKVLISLLADDTQLYKQFSDNATFKTWLTAMVFAATYNP